MNDPLDGLDFDVAEPTDVVDVSKLSNIDLAELGGKVRVRLHQLGEMFTPADARSDEAKDLHSLFTAIQIESKRRQGGLLQ